jgi:hypothetical protein
MCPALFQAAAVWLRVRNTKQRALESDFILSGGFPEAA